MTPSRSQKALKAERDQRLNPKIQSLKRNIAKIAIDQQRIREGQKWVKVRLASVEQQCDQFRKETKIITMRANITKIKLVLMFEILEARKVGDFSKAASLSRTLRFLL
ncbi:hypothetical protein PTKIN_Ptkin14bG0092400 [Pterospermum kingtungense]